MKKEEDVRVNIRLTPKQKKALRHVAAEHGNGNITISSYIRDVVLPTDPAYRQMLEVLTNQEKRRGD